MMIATLILRFPFGIALLAPTWLLATSHAAEPPEFSTEKVAFFDQEVQPLLKENCLRCHGENPEKLKGDLDLRTRASSLQGGETGPAAVPGKASESLLIQAINHSKEGYEMPPSGKLKPEQIAVLTKWVDMGLPYPKALMGTATAVDPKATKITPEQKAYWAYQPIQRPALPADVPNLNPIDQLLNVELTQRNLQPVSKADKATLIRRAYYDLTGLPPSPKEIDEFVADNSPNAWRDLIDSLLASPAYGEKWGRHWLDIVRYAETNGYERDNAKPLTWRYRDYVIRSLNSDKPFNQFAKEQIAGDEMPRTDNPDPIIATGYYRLGVWDDEPADRLQARYDGFDDIITITGQAFLGMTVNCARCHDHKGDPILQTDYYQMLSFFMDISPYSDNRSTISSNNVTDITSPEKRILYEAELTKRNAEIEVLTRKMIAIEESVIKTMSAEDQRASEGNDRPKVIEKVVMLMKQPMKREYNQYKKQINDLKTKPTPNQEFALSVNNCAAVPQKTFVHIRGNPHAEGAEVQPGFPEVLGLPKPTIPAPGANAKSSGRRTVLANWIASDTNPLTPRVWVNRIWQHHFGKGLVPTSNDFGKLGEGVSNLNLLNWLAAELVTPQAAPGQPWTIKRLHKLIMTSDAYQRSSQASEANLKTDPANTYLWRFNMRRLTAEEVRDSILLVSGSLNSEMYGPSVYPKIPREVLAGQSVPGSGWHYNAAKPEEGNRRSIYVHIKRSLQVPILIAHDQADADNSCPVRYTTTVPTQALGMLNGEFTNEQAERLAKRLMQEAPGVRAEQIRKGIRLVTGRKPTDAEVAADEKFILDLQQKHQLSPEKAMAQFALLLLNLNEFIYLD